MNNEIVEYSMPREIIVQVKRCPVVLIVDTSSSMVGKIDELNSGIRAFYNALEQNQMANDCVDIAVIEMGGNKARISQSFTSIEKWNIKKYSANGITPMEGAIDLALNQIFQIKSFYREKSINYYRPWLVIMSDGYPTDENGYFDQNWRWFRNRIKDEIAKKHIVSFTFYIGPSEMQENNEVEKENIKIAKLVLKEIASPDNIHFGKSHAYELANEIGNLTTLFRWLSNSITTVSNGAKNAQISFPPAEPITVTPDQISVTSMFE